MIGTLTLGAMKASVAQAFVPLSAVVRSPSDPRGFAVMLIRERGDKTYAAAQAIESARPTVTPSK